MSTGAGGDAKDIRHPTPDKKLPAKATGGVSNAPEAQMRTLPPSASTSTQPNRSLHSISATEGNEDVTGERQVIAVSASKNPAAFFNLARRFLVTDEFCDLSALEGAIVSAVDAAHLLERSKLAKIVRIQTSYVTVEPRKKSAARSDPDVNVPSIVASSDPNITQIPPPQHYPSTHRRQHRDPHNPEGRRKPHQGKKGTPLRRSRIIITVKKTDDYKAWLDENGGTSTGDIDAHDVNQD